MPNNSTAGGGGGVSGGGGAAGGSSFGGGGRGFGGWFRRKPEPEPSRAHAVVELRVDERVDADLLGDATKRALRAARDALPGRGSVRATAEAGEASDGELRVRVELVVTGPGADADWAKAAEGAFARELCARLQAKGHGARHVS